MALAWHHRLRSRWPDFFPTAELARLVEGRTEFFHEFLETLDLGDLPRASDRGSKSRYIYLKFFLAIAQRQGRVVAQAAAQAATARGPGVPGVLVVPSDGQAWNAAEVSLESTPGVHRGLDAPPGAATHGAKHFYEVMPLLSWLNWAPLVERHEESQLFYDLEAGGCPEETERWVQVWERFLCRGYDGFMGGGFDRHASEILTRKVRAMGAHPGAPVLQRMAGEQQRRCRASRVEFLESLGHGQRLRLEEIEGWLLDLGTQYVRHLRGQGVDLHALAHAQFYVEHTRRLDAIREWTATVGFQKLSGGWAAAADNSPSWRPKPEALDPGVAVSALGDLIRLGMLPRRG